MDTLIPKGYKPNLDVVQTERSIKFVKDHFETALARRLNLNRITAPLFVRVGTGVQDMLNGVERPVTFRVRCDSDAACEIVHSLAKWKRLALYKYGFRHGEGIYTDMNALRPDEEKLDNLHSIYVDQWDWEKVMLPAERNLDFLKAVVRAIYAAIRESESAVYAAFGQRPFLPPDIAFMHSEELCRRYPDVAPKERERRACQEFGACFIIGIGGVLPDGKIHDGRSPDYDDWTTPTLNGCRGLNGDIFVWNPILEVPFELSSMGIRVDGPTMRQQLEIRGCLERLELPWHKLLIEGKLPQSIGGGIGESRLCMLLLQKAHIGEVQVSHWPDEVVETCAKAGIPLL